MALPILDTLDDVIVFNGVEGKTNLTFLYILPPRTDQIWSYSQHLCKELLTYKGQGGLYDNLKK